MPGQIEQIAQMLGGTQRPNHIQGQGMTGTYERQQGHLSAQSGAFDSWLRSLGIVSGNLPPEMKIQYYQMWMQMQQQRAQPMHGGR